MNSSIRIAAWNLAGLRARLELLLDWLRETSPDIVLLQETKIQDKQFPQGAFEDEGYNVVAHGQKTFNGVAILSKFPLEDVQSGLPGDNSDEQARWLEAATVMGESMVRVACLYAPNGNPAPGPKYEYKLAWMKRMHDRTRELLACEEPTVLGGDFNVILTTDDASRPEAWTTDALYLRESRAALRRILHDGWSDAVRLKHEGPGPYSFWDFQRGAWERDDGIRIDHLLLSPQATDRLKSSEVERDMRGRNKPSDHVPVWCELRC